MNVTRLFRIGLSYTSESSGLFGMSQVSVLASLSLSYSELEFIVQIANRMIGRNSEVSRFARHKAEGKDGSLNGRVQKNASGGLDLDCFGDYYAGD